MPSLDDILDTSSGEDSAFEARQKQQIKDLVLEIINGCYELSLTDIELFEHQTKTEMPVISKTGLVEKIEAL